MESRKCGDTNLQLSITGSGCRLFGDGDLGKAQAN